MLGVNSDQDLEMVRHVVAEEEITWRSFWNGPDGTSGPISTRWNVWGWPTVYILDHEGRIHLKGHSLPDEVVDSLLAKVDGQSG